MLLRRTDKLKFKKVQYEGLFENLPINKRNEIINKTISIWSETNSAKISNIRTEKYDFVTPLLNEINRIENGSK